MNKNTEGSNRSRPNDSNGVVQHSNNDQREQQRIFEKPNLSSNPLQLIRMNSLLDNEGEHSNTNSSNNMDDCENDSMDTDGVNRNRTTVEKLNEKDASYIRKRRNDINAHGHDGFSDSDRHDQLDKNQYHEQHRHDHHQNEHHHQNELSNLSPSSMEVDFSNPHEIDHTSFSRHQSEEAINSINNTHNTINNTHDTTRYHFDEEEEQCRDDYVKSGTHFRSLLDCAFRRVATGVHVVAAESIGMNDLFDESTRGESRMNNYIEDLAMSTTPHSGKKRGSAPASDDISMYQRRKFDIGEQRDEDGYRQNKLTSQFAREKMTEILSLKRMLKESEEHANALGLANATLREASATSAARINTLTESIKITSVKVAEARADADMAKAKASSLGTQLKSLKSALTETKHTCESIKTEHDDIQSSARSLEAKLVQTETELRHEEKEKFEIKLERDELRHNLEDLTEANKRAKVTLEKKDDELVRLKKNIAERTELERARRERMNRLENELRGVRSTLVDVTAAAKDAESTNVDLQNTIDTMQRENKTLHDRIEEFMDTSMREKSKLQRALTEVESEAQKLRMKVATDEEDLKRSKLDLMSSEKEVSQLRSRVSTLEARLKEVVPNAGVLSPANHNHIEPMAVDSPLTPATLSQSSSSNTTHKFSKNTTTEKSYNDKENRRPRASNSDLTNNDLIPSLRPTTPKGLSYSQSENKLAASRQRTLTKKPFRRIGGTSTSGNLSSVKCQICNKAAYGIMKSCQCGNPACTLRAHASCVAAKNPPCSVSHPGTPAPLLPCVLCKNN